MTRAEYLKQAEHGAVSKRAIQHIEGTYGYSLPEDLQRLISMSEESIFFDDDFRTLSQIEIIQAEEDLHVDFSQKGLLPLIDCGDNDLIVYHLKNGLWSKFNITDGTIFKQRGSLVELLQ